MYDLAIYIGRFQPLHNGHLHVIKHASHIAKEVCVVVGSATESSSLRNPFKNSDIVETILISSLKNIFVKSISDHPYNDREWAEQIREIALDYENVVIVGHSKDETSFYLNMFPEFDRIEVENFEHISSTDIRHDYFYYRTIPDEDIVPKATINLLNSFMDSLKYLKLQEEFHYVELYKKQFKSLSYPPIFTTVDTLVRWNNEILLIERGNHPGKGLLALPGGFLNANERISDAWARELTEETNLDIEKEILYQCVVSQRVFDDPKRDERGRIITHAVYVDVSSLDEKPKVVAGDDAKAAFWFKIENMRNESFYSDHCHIIRELLDAH